MVARWAHNPKVVRSSRAPATSERFRNESLFLFPIMYTVYVLFSEKFTKIYVGYTSDLTARLVSHNELATKGYTIKYRPWKIIYSEIVELKAEALKREKQLKSAKGREFIWSLIN